MKIADTISVNPSKTALGHVENPTSSIFRSPVIGVEHQAHTFNWLSMVFPTNKSGVTDYKKYEVPLRTLFSTILIVTGITFLTSTSTHINIAFAICSLSFGAILALGLFTRPAMIGAAVYYCVMGALSIRSGAPEVSIFSLMFGCLIFGVLGGGKYSCDALIRKAILRQNKKSEKKSKENVMDYKVFHKVKF